MNVRLSRFGYVLAVVAGLAALLVGLLVSPRGVDLIAALVAGLSALLGVLGGAASYWLVRAKDERFLEPTLLTTSTDIEEAARRFLRSKRPNSTSIDLTVRSLVPALVEEGVWNEEDVTNFRQMLRVRNAVVHGMGEQVKPRDIEEAIEIGGALKTKITARKADVQPGGASGSAEDGLEK